MHIIGKDIVKLWFYAISYFVYKLTALQHIICASLSREGIDQNHICREHTQPSQYTYKYARCTILIVQMHCQKILHIQFMPPHV